MTDLIEDMKYTILPADAFKEFFGFFKFYKITDNEEYERQHKLQDGLNYIELTQKNGFCDGGITFTIQDNLFKSIFSHHSKYIREVMIADDALIFVDTNSFRADKVILLNRIEISDSDIWNDLEFCKQTVLNDYKYLNYIKNPPNELLDYIISKRPLAIECISNPSPEIVNKVLSDNPYMIKYIKDPKLNDYLLVYEKNKYTLQSIYIDPFILEELIKLKPEIKILRENNTGANNCNNNLGFHYPYQMALEYRHKNKKPETIEESIEEIKKNPYHIKNIDQTQELCNLAFSLNKGSFKNIRPEFMNTNMCNEAVNSDYKLLIYVPHEYTVLMDQNIIISALSKNGRFIDNIPNPTHEMCIAALNCDPESIYNIKESFRTPELIYHIAKKNPRYYHLLDKIDIKDEAILKDIMRIYPTYYAKFTYKTKELSDIVTFKCPEMIKCVPKEFQDEEMCLGVTFFSPLMLEYVTNQTEKICLNAVSRNGLALKYVKNKTPEICQKALDNTEFALEFIENQTEEMCINAIKRDIKTIAFVLNMTEKILETALDLNIGLFRDAVNLCPDLLTIEMICKVVSKNGLLLKYVPSEFFYIPNPIIETALNNNPEAIEFVPEYKLSVYLILKSVRKNGNAIRFIPDKYHSEIICVEAVKSQPNSLRYISSNKQTDEICLTALEQDALSFEYIKNKKPEFCFYAVSKNAAVMANINTKDEILYQMCLCINPKALHYIRDIDIRQSGTELLQEIESMI